MFNIYAVRERVEAKLKAIRNVSEETIHRAYAEEINRELESAKTVALNLQQNFRRANAGWTADKSLHFIRASEFAEAETIVDLFVGQFR